MKLTVLGNYGPYPASGGATSGYLLETENAKILLDCGSGVLGNLQKYCHIEELTHIILSHLHYDHTADMMVLRYAIEGKKKRGQKVSEIKLFMPNEPAEEFEKISSKELFDITVLNENTKMNIPGLAVSFKKMSHPITCFGSKFVEVNKTFVYSGDTALNGFPADFIIGCDVFLCDAGLLSKDKKSENVPHFTAREAGMVSKDAGVKRLLLTHFWPEDDKIEHLKEAREHFPTVELAEQDKAYQI